MTISALVSNFNYGRYVGNAIASALQQTAKVAEVVVVDDGSTDGSRDVIESLASEHDAVIPLFQKNGGQSAAINAGFGRCTGEIVCMLDADDVWHQGKVERVAAAFATVPTAAMVMHKYDAIDSNGDTIHSGKSRPYPIGDLGQVVVESGGAWIFGATSSLSLKRSALSQILPIPAERWRLCADGALAYPAAFLGTVVSLEEILGSYRLHGNNNHFAAGLDLEKVQSDIEMTNRYLNDFLARIGRPERVDLARNLSYRRDRFYINGGGPLEAIAIAKLIMTWPLYDGSFERARFLARFVGRWLTARRSTRR